MTKWADGAAGFSGGGRTSACASVLYVAMRASYLIRHQCIRAPLHLRRLQRSSFVAARLNRATIASSASELRYP